MTAIVGCIIFILLLVPAVIIDLKHKKIPNILSIATILIGFFYNFYVSKLDGLLFSISGAFIGFILMLILYWFAAVGGGDVKFFAAAGSVLGPKSVFYLVLVTLLLAGLLALVLIIIKIFRNVSTRNERFVTADNNYLKILNLINCVRGNRTKIPLMPLVALAVALTAINAYYL